jgi:hypothetical protein
MTANLLYLKDVAVNGFGSLSETAPSSTTTGTGWVVAKNSSANFSKLLYGTERSGAFSTTDGLTTAAVPASGDSWRSENVINGIFANANWVMTFAIRAVTAASSQAGRVKVRLWRGTNAAGTGATQITASALTGTTSAALSTSADATSVVTFTPGATITLTNEYLFVQCEWEITTASGSNSGDVDFRAGTASNMALPAFTAASVGSSSGAGAASGNGTGQVESNFSSAGTSTASGKGIGINAATATAACTSTAAAVGTGIVIATALASSTSAAAAVGIDANAFLVQTPLGNPFGGLRSGNLSKSATAITNPLVLTGTVNVSYADLILVIIAEQNDLTSTSVTDNLGNTYFPCDTGGLDVGIVTGRAFYSRVQNKGALTSINVATTASANQASAMAVVFVGPVGVLDAYSTPLSDNTTPIDAPATGTLATADELVITWFAQGDNKNFAPVSGASQGFGWTGTSLTGPGSAGIGIGWLKVSSTASLTPSWQQTTGDPAAMVVGTASFTRDLGVAVGRATGNSGDSATVYSKTLSSFTSGYGGSTTVSLIPGGNLDPFGGSEVRLSLSFIFTNSGLVSQVYIGQQAPVGFDPYDFNNTPTHVTFGGGDLTFDGTTTTWVSDWVTLPEAWNTARNYLVAVNWSASGAVYLSVGLDSTSSLGSEFYQLTSSADAATVDKTGYAATSFHNVGSVVSKIEVRGPAKTRGVGSIVTTSTVTGDGAASGNGASNVVGQAVSAGVRAAISWLELEAVQGVVNIVSGVGTASGVGASSVVGTSPIVIGVGSASGTSTANGVGAIVLWGVGFAYGISGRDGTVFNRATINTSAAVDAWTTVSVIDNRYLVGLAGTEARITVGIRDLGGGGGTGSAFYFGQQSATGDPYDFKSTPVHVLFGGTDPIAVGSLTNIFVSDWFTLPEPFDNTKNYICAVNWGTPGSIFLISVRDSPGSSPGNSYYLKSGSGDAATIDKSGYGLSLSNTTVVLSTIEVRGAPAGTQALSFYFSGSAFPLVPDADNTDGGWTNETGGTVLYSSVDEAAPNDSDYIISSDRPVSDICKISVSNPGGGIQAPLAVFYRYKKSGSNAIDLRVRLLEGGTQIASWTHTNIDANFISVEQVLSSGELASISDPTNLFLEFKASV